MTGKKLVIVESPAKAKTITKILGRGYTIMASVGHIRDLPKSKLGVDPENKFEPKYVVPRLKTKVVNELKAAAKEAGSIYLATDPDREGEAIAWHLAEVTNAQSKPHHRVVFHEITEEAVKAAFQHPRQLDMNLVNAQQARRILDRLVGYKISPLLWSKIRRGLSAGRVQSVAVKIIVDREREILAFVPNEYWSIDAELSKKKDISFIAGLVGQYTGEKLELHNQQDADAVKNELEKAHYSVAKVTTKQTNRQPTAPFITSSLQQEAWRKLHFTAKRTMAIAQQLYEGLAIGAEGTQGLITYMRTDSTHVAQSAITETREYITETFGKEYTPEHARVFHKVAKGAQEAHEAIRPTKIHREPGQMKQYLDHGQFKLYELIWKRMVASQMAAAVFDNTSVDIKAKAVKNTYLFRVSNSVNVFPGFMKLYAESVDDVSEEEKESRLPKLEKADELDLKKLIPQQHFTQPPFRYTEATLVKALEQWGIGRPSTYAPIISTIQDRGYVAKLKGAFQPTDIGFLVNDLLIQYFPDILDLEFTAHMETDLDEVAAGDRLWNDVVGEFYVPFSKDLAVAESKIEKVKLADELTGEMCPQCGKPIAIKIGRFGKFLACTGYPACKFTGRYLVKTGVKCPLCAGEIVQKVSKNKRTFYGCANYPTCNFAMNAKPLPEPCPQCGGMLTAFRGGAKCTKCEYKGKPGE